MEARREDPLAQPRVRRAWYVACASDELRTGPLALSLHDTPIVLFRDDQGRAGALLDRCPHRNVPLSFGKVEKGTLQCGYHGWRFDGRGRCVHIPGLGGQPDTPGRKCASFPTIEQQGFVWVWADPDTQPTTEPFRFRLADDPRYLTVRRALEAPASVHAVAENALDVPHTAFLHGGLFRKDGERKPITCKLKRWADGAEVEYIGEARPEGLAGRVLSPSGGVVTHFDRFFLPSILEVEYRIGEENHILLNGALTPLSDHRTRLFAVVSVRTRFPAWLVRPLVQPLALRIFSQDVQVLGLQTETIHRFGDARFVSTEIDLLGPHVLRLLRQAERGEAGEPYEKEVTMLV